LQAVTRQEIRPVRSSEIEQVSLIEQACFKDPYPTYFLSQLARDNPETFLVLSLDDQVIGYGVIDRWEGHDHLISIAVLPDRRKSGFGEALLRELENRISRDRVLKLEVRQSNGPAIQLYSKRGFTRTGVVEGYYTDGEDAIIMEKRLSQESSITAP
jgi:ribosomal-protein-alanine N-acetyltransferase